LRLKPFGKQSVKVLWLHQWDNSSMTSDGHHKGAAGKLRGLSLIFFVIVSLFSLMLFDSTAIVATTGMRFFI